MYKLGEKSICKSCDKPIEYIGPYWRHIGLQPRHIAEPQGKLYFFEGLILTQEEINGAMIKVSDQQDEYEYCQSEGE